jgi:hypothetical protein
VLQIDRYRYSAPGALRSIPELLAIAGLGLGVVVDGGHDGLHQNVATRHRHARALGAGAKVPHPPGARPSNRTCVDRGIIPDWVSGPGRGPPERNKNKSQLGYNDYLTRNR